MLFRVFSRSISTVTLVELSPTSSGEETNDELFLSRLQVIDSDGDFC